MYGFEFGFQVGDLTDFMVAVGNALGRKRAAVPILESVLVELRDDGRVWVSAFNYEVGIEAVLPSATGVVHGGAGRVLLRMKDVRDLLSAGGRRDLVRIESIDLEPGRVSVGVWAPSAAVPGYKGVLEVLPIEDYPQVYAVGMERLSASVWVSGVRYRDGMKIVQRAVAGNEQNLPMLTGIQMQVSGGEVNLRSTDRFRAHHVRVSENVDPAVSGDWVTPGAPIAKTAGWLVGGTTANPQAQTVEIGTVARGSGQPSWVAVRTGDRVVSVRLLDVSFPKVDNLFPQVREEPVSVLVDPAAVRKALKPFLKGSRVTVTLEGNQVTIGDDKASQTLAAAVLEIDATLLRIGFCPAYLNDAMASVPKGQKARIGIRTATRPATITWDDDATRLLLMPVRLEAQEQNRAA